jgi:hypothetical protein
MLFTTISYSEGVFNDPTFRTVLLPRPTEDTDHLPMPIQTASGHILLTMTSKLQAITTDTEIMALCPKNYSDSTQQEDVFEEFVFLCTNVS